jgi:DNA helicase-2/ATP-dependent DNA helicase PcrA
MMDELNDAQRAVVAHGDTPLLVIAGAGSGKTKTLAYRVGRLLADGIAPERICLLTFSRRAAEEMIRRAGLLGDRGAASRVVGGTFHAVGNRLLRRYGRSIGVSTSFSVLDEADASELMGLVRHECGVASSGGRRFPRADTLVAIYSRMVNAQEKLPVVLADWFPAYGQDADAIKTVFAAYTARKRQQQTFDFDDLLLFWRVLAQAQPPDAVRLFDYVLVDEYQDVNGVQADIVAALAPAGTGVTVVGDDAQSIYGFRAATVANILGFEARYPATTVIRLEENYRSINPILAVANAVMADATEGYAKHLWSQRPGSLRPLLRSCTDQTTEAAAVCDSVLAHRDQRVALMGQAVLFRAAHHSAQLELELTRRNVPYKKFGGLRFLEAGHIKDLLALLRVVDNSYDELAWSRSLRLLDTVGPAMAAKIMDIIGVRHPNDAANVGEERTPLAQFLASPPIPPRVDPDEVHALRDALADCADRSAATPPPRPGAQVGRLRIFLEPIVQRRYDAAESRVADLEQLEHAAAAFTSRHSFLSDLTLDPPSSTSDLAGPPLVDDEYLTLSTVHSAKGGEWDVVHVIGAADGMIPSDMALRDRGGLEEERRLFYVAVTRARNVLEISYPTRFFTRPNRLDDNYGYGQPSRFLTDDVIAHLDRTDVHTITADDPADNAVIVANGERAVDDLLSNLLG